MNENLLTKEKFVLKLICVVAGMSLLFACLLGADRYHERCIKLKLAELDYVYIKEATNGKT